MTHPVKIEWLSEQDGGRKQPPPAGSYFAVSRFAEDIDWQNNAWSVVFDIYSTEKENSGYISKGSVRFLIDNAPQARMEENKSFDIYEGPKKVARVSLAKNGGGHGK